MIDSLNQSENKDSYFWNETHNNILTLDDSYEPIITRQRIRRFPIVGETSWGLGALSKLPHGKI